MPTPCKSTNVLQPIVLLLIETILDTYPVIRADEVAKKTATPLVPSSYDLMSMRIQRTINATGAHTSKRALIYKAADESDDDWMNLLNAIDEADNVTLTNREDEGVEVTWVVPKED